MDRAQAAVSATRLVCSVSISVGDDVGHREQVGARGEEEVGDGERESSGGEERRALARAI